MAQYFDMKPRFSKGCGGNIKVEILDTGSNGEAQVAVVFYMPRGVFFEAVAEGSKFIGELQREEAEATILTLPKGRLRKKG